MIRRLAARVLGRGLRDDHVAHVHGVPLIVLADVFDPAAFRSGALLAEVVRDEPIAGRRVLDLGCGSGVGSVFAARAGAEVVAVDVNPAAVRCARANAALHDLQVDVREGDLLGPVAGERFDRVLFNPPFYRGRPRSAWDAAWRGEDVLERFAAGLGAVLAPGGAALVVLSSDGACDELLADLRGRGFGLVPALRRRWPGETVTVWRVRSGA